MLRRKHILISRSLFPEKNTKDLNHSIQIPVGGTEHFPAVKLCTLVILHLSPCPDMQGPIHN